MRFFLVLVVLGGIACSLHGVHSYHIFKDGGHFSIFKELGEKIEGFEFFLGPVLGLFKGIKFKINNQWTKTTGFENRNSEKFILWENENIKKITTFSKLCIRSIIIETDTGRSFQIGNPVGVSSTIFPPRKGLVFNGISGYFDIICIKKMSFHWTYDPEIIPPPAKTTTIAPAKTTPTTSAETTPTTSAKTTPTTSATTTPTTSATTTPTTSATTTPTTSATTTPTTPDKTTPTTPDKTTPTTPDKTTPTTPAETTPAAPAETTPAAPAETTSAAPAENTPTASDENTPTAPAENTPTASDENTPTAPAENTPTASAENTPTASAKM